MSTSKKMYQVGIILCAISLFGCGNKQTTPTQEAHENNVPTTPSSTDATVPTTNVVPSSPSLGKDSLSGVSKYQSILHEKYAEYDAMPLEFAAESCPPPVMFANNEYHKIEFQPFAKGSMTELYDTDDFSLVLKLQNPPSVELLDGLWREIAAGSILGESEYFPTFYNPEFSDQVSEYCAIRILVMSNAGMTSLSDPRNVDLLSIEDLAVRCMSILNRVHSVGIIHGDVHKGNFVFTDSLSTVKLIDFGRSTEWLDFTTGEHMTISAAYVKEKNDRADFKNSRMSLNVAYLSPFEIQGIPRSRRDDMFRLAEMLIALLDQEDLNTKYYIDGFFTDEATILDLKIAPKFSAKIPKKFQDFYRYTLGLEFDQAPDYSLLSNLFTKS